MSYWMSTRRRGASLVVAVAAVLTLALVGAPTSGANGASAAPPAVSVGPKVGPPTSSVIVTVWHFGASERVDIYFDGTTSGAVGSFVTSSSGFGSARLAVPAWARPKTHNWIARGRTSQRQAVARFLVRTDWVQRGFDASHRSYNPYENVLNKQTVSSLHRVLSVNGRGGNWPWEPVVANGMLYIGTTYPPPPSRDNKAEMDAFDATTGALRWHTTLNAGSPNIWPPGQPSTANGTVFTYTMDTEGRNNFLWALNATTGQVRWKVATAPRSASELPPTVAQGVVLLGTQAFDASTGALRWQMDDSEGIGRFSATNGVFYGVDDTASGGTVLEARDVRTGNVRWMQGTTPGATLPVVANGILYYGSSGQLKARSAGTGALLWATSATAPVGQPVVGPGVVYAMVGFHAIEAFDAATGAVLWTNSIGAWDEQQPVLANGVLYQHLLYSVAAYDAASGKLLKTISTGPNRTGWGSIAVVNGVLYAQSGDATASYAAFMP